MNGAVALLNHVNKNQPDRMFSQKNASQTEIHMNLINTIDNQASTFVSIDA